LTKINSSDRAKFYKLSPARASTFANQAVSALVTTYNVVQLMARGANERTVDILGVIGHREWRDGHRVAKGHFGGHRVRAQYKYTRLLAS
jgi:hypothetical protein